MEIALILFIFIFWIAIIVGMFFLFVWVCKKMAESKGLPNSYKWFGLLGVVGIIIVAVINAPTYNQYPPQNGYGQNPYPQQNNYGQNPYPQQNSYVQNPNPNPQQNTYFGSNPYQQSQQFQQPQQPIQQSPVGQSQQQQPSVEQTQQNSMKFCPHCGAPVDAYSVSCKSCGQMLR